MSNLLPRLARDKLLFVMIPSLLLVTPQASFGEYVRQSLENKYPAHIVIVDNKIAAFAEIERQNFTHAFLDTDLKTETVLEIGLVLHQTNTELRLILVSGNQNPPHYVALRPWTLLPKPFHLTDLLRVLGDEASFGVALPATEKEATKTPAPPEDELNWLYDVSKAAQHLTRLTLESSAQAALIVRDGALWASSGQLLQIAITELAKMVIQDKKTGDLLKFIRLESTQAEHMLYATQLAEDINLAMVFDAETPFSTIRRQATHLAESLAFSPQQETPSETPSTKIDTPLPPDDDEREILQALFDFGDEDGELPPISEILENIPSPNPLQAASEVKTSIPASTPSAASRISSEPMPSPFGGTRPTTPLHSQKITRESSPAMHLATELEIEETRPQIAQRHDDLDLAATRISKSTPRPETPLDLSDIDLVTRISKAAPRPETPIEVPGAESLLATRPHSITEVAERVLSEPVSHHDAYDLTYACLLLPRFDTHHLAGDLADRLSEWMPKISIAFGWRLEYISVRPDYLQWVINVPPTASPGYLMRIIRKQTSSKIFDNFPRIKDENPSGDFWAPGYLIMGGSQPHPSKLVQDYIKRTRERQGML